MFFVWFARDVRCQNPRLPSVFFDVTASALVVTGVEDRLVPQEYGRTFAKLIPDARFLAIEECGHAASIEKPDEIALEITRFIASRRSTSD